MALDPDNRRAPQRVYGDALHPQTAPSNLADILERVLDKGIVIAGDIQLNLLDIELITLKIRLLIASVDRAREMGINWWESDPSLSAPREERVEFRAEIDRENGNTDLEARIARIERQLLGSGGGESGGPESGGRETGGRATTPRQTGGATRGPASRPKSARRATGSQGGNAQKG
jgi:Gas vesicle protein